MESKPNPGQASKQLFPIKHETAPITNLFFAGEDDMEIDSMPTYGKGQKEEVKQNQTKVATASFMPPARMRMQKEESYVFRSKSIEPEEETPKHTRQFQGTRVQGYDRTVKQPIRNDKQLVNMFDKANKITIVKVNKQETDQGEVITDFVELKKRWSNDMRDFKNNLEKKASTKFTVPANMDPKDLERLNKNLSQFNKLAAI